MGGNKNIINILFVAFSFFIIFENKSVNVDTLIFFVFFTFFHIFCMIIMGEDKMKKLNINGWGLSAMIGFMVGFVIFLIVISFLAYKLGFA